MKPRDDLVIAGEVLKVHGLDGGMVIRFREPFCPLPEIPPFVFIRVEGLPVPFPVEEAGEFGPCSYLFFFEDVTTRDRALRYRGAEVLLEPKYLPAGNHDPFSFTGYTFEDTTSGITGTITGFLDIPENPLFEATSGQATYMIPAREAFITRIDRKSNHVRFALPEGLFNPEET